MLSEEALALLSDSWIIEDVLSMIACANIVFLENVYKYADSAYEMGSMSAYLVSTWYASRLAMIVSSFSGLVRRVSSTSLLLVR